MILRIGSLDKPPAERLSELAESMGLGIERVKETCTGPTHHKGKPLFLLVLEGETELIQQVLDSDPGMAFRPSWHCGSHPTGRRWWSH